MELCREILSTHLDQMKSDKISARGAGEVAWWVEHLVCKPGMAACTCNPNVGPGRLDRRDWWCGLAGQPGRDEKLLLVLRMRWGQSWQQEHCPTPHIRTVSGLVA